MSNLPVISVLMATYNRAQFLPETIRCIQNQIERGFTHELIIVDNASSDNTEQIVREFMAQDPRIKYLRNDQNHYASGALNQAFELSTGQLIMPFDDDDILPELSLQMRFDAMKDPRVMWTSGLCKRVDQEGRLYPQEKDRPSYYLRILPFLDENYELTDPAGLFEAFFNGWMICGGTVTIRRECVAEVGGWDPNFPVMQDAEMWIKLAHKHYHYKFINSILFFYRRHTNQITAANASRERHHLANQVLRKKYGKA